MSTPVKHKSDRYDCSEKPHFHCVNVNPVRRHTGDCVIRAMALFLQWTWTDVMKDLMAYCIENGYLPNYKSGYGAYLTCQGFPWRKVSGKCTVKEFLEKYAKPGRSYLLSTSNHMTCIREGKIHDTWDCSGRQVKFYWEKEDDNSTSLSGITPSLSVYAKPFQKKRYVYKSGKEHTEYTPYEPSKWSRGSSVDWLASQVNIIPNDGFRHFDSEKEREQVLQNLPEIDATEENAAFFVKMVTFIDKANELFGQLNDPQYVLALLAANKPLQLDI